MFARVHARIHRRHGRELLPAAAVWLAAVWLATAGCGEQRCVPDGTFGSCCASDVDCPAELECLQQFPGGLCSRDCAADPFCPTAGRCVHIISKSRGDLGHACLLRCGPAYPACRPDYSCTATSDPELKVCFPG